MRSALRAVVAIPVCNEAERVAACLAAFGAQRGHEPAAFGLVVFVNNSQDGTIAVVRSVGSMLPCPVRVLEDRAPRAPSAGWARRVATEAAAEWLADTTDRRHPAVVLSTDADSVVPPDWIARNLAAIDAGVDAVAGAIDLDPADAARLPAALHARGQLEGAYESLLAEFASRLRPVAHDPWPRHWTTSGASLAMTLDAYRRVGGMPDCAAGEDRAMVAALLAAGLRVRHDPAIRVVTSGRLVGRAVGGAADTMRLRATDPEAPCDERLEPMLRFAARLLLGLRLPTRTLRPSELPRQIRIAAMAVRLLRMRAAPGAQAKTPGLALTDASGAAVSCASRLELGSSASP